MQEFKLVMEKASGELEEILVPEGTTFEEIAKSYQEDYKDLIVLACVDGKLRELNKEIKKRLQCEISYFDQQRRKAHIQTQYDVADAEGNRKSLGRTGACAAFVFSRRRILLQDGRWYRCDETCTDQGRDASTGT